MQRIHKTLAICLLVTALVYCVICTLDHMRVGERAHRDAKAASKHSVRDHDEENAADLATRKMRMRSRKLSNAEAREFLAKTIIPEINFENITLQDALESVNVEIEKQTPDDQSRPKILMSPHSAKSSEVQLSEDELLGSSITTVIRELRLRNVPADVLLKYMCDITRSSYWFYKGDCYIDHKDCGCGQRDFYSEELLNRVKLDNIDPSQLSSKLGEIIEQHDYFGPKYGVGVSVYTTNNARAAILNGTIKLPRIDVDLHDISLEQAVLKIAEQSNGALQPHYKDLIFNPLNEKLMNDDPFSSAFNPNGATASVILDESIFKPESNLPNQELPSAE